MNGILERTLGILEYLAVNADGVPMATIADEIGIPRSAAHRLLADLSRCGYVRQTRKHGDYVLTTKLASLGLIHLSSTGIVDIAPIIATPDGASYVYGFQRTLSDLYLVEGLK